MLHLFHKRQGQMEIAGCYFYTDSISEFKKLLTDDNLKMKIIESWQYLTEKKLIKIYGYVIMPNHIHLLWQILDQNEKKALQAVLQNIQHINSKNIYKPTTYICYSSLNLINLTDYFSFGKETRWQYPLIRRKFYYKNWIIFTGIQYMKNGI